MTHEFDTLPERIRLLVVDDDADDFFVTNLILEEIQGVDIETEWVHSYADAVTAIESSRHDVCLLDYRLGERTGVELLHETAQRGFTLPVILLTGQGDRDTDVAAMRAGAADYLVKGQIDAHELERAIRYALDRARNLNRITTAQQRYDLAEIGTSDGLWDWSLRNEEIYFSAQWLAMIGDRDGERIENKAFWYERVHPGDVDRLDAEIQSHLFGLTPTFRCEYRVRHMDGTYRWVLARAIAVRDGEGRPYRMVGTQIDITERRQAVERLLSNVSHELRTPLNAIYQFVTILLDGLAGDLSGDQRDYLEIAHGNTLQLKKLIGDLMEVTRANTGRLHIQPRPFDLIGLIAETLETQRASTDDPALELACDSPEPETHVFADPSRVRQVLLHLLDNARKFTPDGGSVTVRAYGSELEQGMVCVEVADTGCGISSQATHRIFESLYQGDDSSSRVDPRKGLGLGLYIARELVTRQGGRIWVQSELDHGSTFYFTLPEYTDAPAADAAPVPPAS